MSSKLGLLLTSYLAGGQSAAENASSYFDLPTYMISLRANSYNRRVMATKRAKEAGVRHMEFVDAVDYHDTPTMRYWLEGRNFSHFNCPQWRHGLLEKKVAVWASHMVVLEKMAKLSTPSLMLEEDIVYMPEPKSFAPIANRVLEFLPDTHLFEWDLVFFGSCVEELHRVTRCREVRSHGRTRGNRLWLSRAFAPTCAHGLLFSPRGAAKLKRMMSGWGPIYHERSLKFTSAQPRVCTDEAVLQHQRRGAGKAAFRELYAGDDQVIRTGILDGQVYAYEVWPMLTEQLPRLKMAAFSYDHKIPHACKAGQLVGR